MKTNKKNYNKKKIYSTFVWLKRKLTYKNIKLI